MVINGYKCIYRERGERESSQNNLNTNTQYISFLYLNLNHLVTVYTAHYPYYFWMN